MPPFAPLLTKDHFLKLSERHNAMPTGIKETDAPFADFKPEVVAAAQSLVLNLPSIDWVIEVDVFGQHRVVIHFKGAEIDIDE